MKKNHILSFIFISLIVIGIGTAIAVTLIGRKNEAISFALEKASVPNIGFIYIPVVSQEASNSSLADNTGVLITDVLRNSPAEKAGLKAGDIIVSYNGTPITKEQPLFGVMRRCAGGTNIEIEIIRSNATQTFLVSCPAP